MLLVLIGSIFLLFLLLGTPVGLAMGIASVTTLIFMKGSSWVIVSQKLFQGLNVFPLMAVPFFILAGMLMNTGGITRRIVNLSGTLVGHFRGGLAQVNIVASMFFADISGSASADASAIGSMLIPAMTREGYPPPFSVGVTASSSTIGPIIPPSIGMVVIGSMTGIPIAALFLAGFVPGILVGLSLMVVTYIYSYKRGYGRHQRATFKQVLVAFKEASLAIIAPVIILGGILSGVFTATEAGVVASFYSFFVGYFIYREFKIRQIIDVVYDSAIITSVTMLIAGFARLFGWILAREQLPVKLANVMLAISSDPRVIIFIILGFLFFVGLFVESMASKIMFIPVLFPVAEMFDFNLLHFAFIFHYVTLVGAITPPVGLLLFISCAIGNVRVSEAIIWPFVAAMIAVLILITIFSPLVLFVPRFFLGTSY